jgi:hypothetical protein
MLRGLPPLLATLLAPLLLAPPALGQPEPVVREQAGTFFGRMVALEDFQRDLGGGNTETGGSFGGLRREIPWDDIPAGQASPNPLPADFYNTTVAHGVVLSTPGTGFEVSGATADVGAANVEFGNIDPSYPTIFQRWTQERIFTPRGSTVTVVRFFLPGTTTPALTRGFGAVFTDVDRADITTIELIDGAGARLLSRSVPVSDPADEGLSFLGVSFPGDPPRIARVRIVSGNAPLAPGTPDSTGGDLVAMDDFIYGEPLEAGRDGDGVDDAADNCPADFNPEQTDTDGDALGDACEQDERDGDERDDGDERERPRLRRLDLDPRRFPAARSGASVAGTAAGTTVNYRLSEDARVRFTVRRRVSRRSRPGFRFRRVGSFAHDGGEGANEFRFTGRVRRRALASGRYRLIARARDGDGMRSPRRRESFRIAG